VDRDSLTDSEQAVWDAFPTGVRADLEGAAVRASVLEFLLRGGLPRQAGHQAALRLSNALIQGRLDLTYADVTAPISLRSCEFGEHTDIYSARLRQLTFKDCTVPGLNASNATFDLNIRIERCRITGPLNLAGTQVAASVILDGSTLTGQLNGTNLRIGNNLLMREGFSAAEVILLNNADIGGSLHAQGARIAELSGLDLRVAAIANLCDGFASAGRVRLSYAHITSRLCFEGATLAEVDLRHLTTDELALLHDKCAAVDLRQATVGLLVDSPATWPATVRLDGLTYDAILPTGPIPQRLRWLRLDGSGFRPRPYRQLAAVYRAEGRDADARRILLAAERHRRETLPGASRIWSYLEDLTVGYGYLPTRAAGWLVSLIVVGAVVFALSPPSPVDAKGPSFNAVVYALDLVLPVIDLGQQSAFRPQGAGTWLAFALTAAGLLFITTITAAAARRLRRD
jgi:hypothetical protein